MFYADSTVHDHLKKRKIKIRHLFELTLIGEVLACREVRGMYLSFPNKGLKLYPLSIIIRGGYEQIVTMEENSKEAKFQRINDTIIFPPKSTY